MAPVKQVVQVLRCELANVIYVVDFLAELVEQENDSDSAANPKEEHLHVVVSPVVLDQWSEGVDEAHVVIEEIRQQPNIESKVKQKYVNSCAHCGYSKLSVRDKITITTRK